MQKSSTVARKQIRNFSEQKLTIGLDLGDRSSWYCVLEEHGEVVLEQKLGTTPKGMKAGFGGLHNFAPFVCPSAITFKNPVAA